MCHLPWQADKCHEIVCALPGSGHDAMHKRESFVCLRRLLRHSVPRKGIALLKSVHGLYRAVRVAPTAVGAGCVPAVNTVLQHQRTICEQTRNLGFISGFQDKAQRPGNDCKALFDLVAARLYMWSVRIYRRLACFGRDRQKRRMHWRSGKSAYWKSERHDADWRHLR